MGRDERRSDEEDLARLLSLYGHIVDAKEWKNLDQVFTDDIVVDGSDLRMPPMNGLPALIAVFQTAQHPIAHHITNVIVEWDEEDWLMTIRSKWLAVREDGTVASGDYVDRAVRNEKGWRISQRTATMRRQHNLPATSRGGSIVR